MTTNNHEKVVEILGVVGHRGASASRVPPEKLWWFNLELDWWRDPDGVLRKEMLRVKAKVPYQDAQQLQEEFSRYQIYRLSVQLADGQSTAELVSIDGVVTDDEELMQRLEELQSPVTADGGPFGTLVFDPALDWYQTQFAWGSQEIELYFSATDEEELEELLAVVTTFWTQQAQWDRRVRRYASAQLLELRNEEWRPDGENILSETDFVEAMTPESITIYPGGRFSICYDDGGLFWGHLITVGGSLDGEFEYADIQG